MSVTDLSVQASPNECHPRFQERTAVSEPRHSHEPTNAAAGKHDTPRASHYRWNTASHWSHSTAHTHTHTHTVSVKSMPFDPLDCRNKRLNGSSRKQFIKRSYGNRDCIERFADHIDLFIMAVSTMRFSMHLLMEFMMTMAAVNHPTILDSSNPGRKNNDRSTRASIFQRNSRVQVRWSIFLLRTISMISWCDHVVVSHTRLWF